MLELPTRVKPLCCTFCGKKVWRTVHANRADHRQGIAAGREFALWPINGTVFAVLRTESGKAPGIPFCPGCAPPIGERALDMPGLGPVMEYERGNQRYYEMCFTPEKQIFFRAWLADALSLETHQIRDVMEQWVADRG